MTLIACLLAVFLLCCIMYLMCIVWQHRSDPQKMGSVPQALATICGAVILIVGWLVTNQQSIDRDVATKKREILASVAEYLTVASFLNENDPPELYRKANQMAWQLAIWLPPDMYRKVVQGVAQKDFHGDWETLISVRKQLLGPEAGDLGPEDAILHAPGIGKSNK
jgi:hypothetical protein